MDPDDALAPPGKLQGLRRNLIRQAFVEEGWPHAIPICQIVLSIP